MNLNCRASHRPVPLTGTDCMPVVCLGPHSPSLIARRTARLRPEFIAPVQVLWTSTLEVNGCPRRERKLRAESALLLYGAFLRQTRCPMRSLTSKEDSPRRNMIAYFGSTDWREVRVENGFIVTCYTPAPDEPASPHPPRSLTSLGFSYGREGPQRAVSICSKSRLPIVEPICF